MKVKYSFHDNRFEHSRARPYLGITASTTAGPYPGFYFNRGKDRAEPRIPKMKRRPVIERRRRVYRAPKAPSEVGYGKEVSPSQPTGGSGERRELP